VPPPDAVVKNLMARQAWPGIPALRDIIQAPIFAADQSLITTPGYHKQARLWYAPRQALEVTVPTAPTNGDVERALAWLMDDLLGDFPFDGEASKAHALAAILLPFVRELVHGPTPLHLFTAPTPGSGKGLLVDIVSLIATGRPASMVSMPRDDEEMRKRITAQLRRGTPMVVLDNINAKLDSAALCSALTATEWEDRILGVSEMTAPLPNRAVWAATANNPELSLDIARRTVTCRLDPGLERPWERDGFRHPDLRTWVLTHRGELVSAALTLVRLWLVEGAPRLEHPPIGSFEGWAEVMAGVLGMARVPGLLMNYRDAYEAASQDAGDWLTFVEAWYQAHGGQPVLVRALHALARQQEMLGEVIGDESERSQQSRLGRALAERKGRVFGGCQILAEKRGKEGLPYRLRVTGDAR
jgi:putative DNA primase/helicase